MSAGVLRGQVREVERRDDSGTTRARERKQLVDGRVRGARFARARPRPRRGLRGRRWPRAPRGGAGGRSARSAAGDSRATRNRARLAGARRRVARCASSESAISSISSTPLRGATCEKSPSPRRLADRASRLRGDVNRVLCQSASTSAPTRATSDTNMRISSTCCTCVSTSSAGATSVTCAPCAAGSVVNSACRLAAGPDRNLVPVGHIQRDAVLGPHQAMQVGHEFVGGIECRRRAWRTRSQPVRRRARDALERRRARRGRERTRAGCRRPRSLR